MKLKKSEGLTKAWSRLIWSSFAVAGVMMSSSAIAEDLSQYDRTGEIFSRTFIPEIACQFSTGSMNVEITWELDRDSLLQTELMRIFNRGVHKVSSKDFESFVQNKGTGLFITPNGNHPEIDRAGARQTPQLTNNSSWTANTFVGRARGRDLYVSAVSYSEVSPQENRASYALTLSSTGASGDARSGSAFVVRPDAFLQTVSGSAYTLLLGSYADNSLQVDFDYQDVRSAVNRIKNERIQEVPLQVRQTAGEMRSSWNATPQRVSCSLQSFRASF